MIRYKKHLKLKQWVKDFLLVNLIFAIVITGFIGYANKIEKINNGQIELVYQYGGDV